MGFRCIIRNSGCDAAFFYCGAWSVAVCVVRRQCTGSAGNSLDYVGLVESGLGRNATEAFVVSISQMFPVYFINRVYPEYRVLFVLRSLRVLQYWRPEYCEYWE